MFAKLLYCQPQNKVSSKHIILIFQESGMYANANAMYFPNLYSSLMAMKIS